MTIAVFFYTRCENDTKCPLTIAKLGRLRKRLRETGLSERIQTAAIRYDPAFDLPIRLEQYARSYGAEAEPGHPLLRTVGEFTPIRNYFELGVNYDATVVNRHQLQVFVLDAEGRVAVALTRLTCTETDLLDRAKSLLTNDIERA